MSRRMNTCRSGKTTARRRPRKPIKKKSKMSEVTIGQQIIRDLPTASTAESGDLVIPFNRSPMGLAREK